ncbi:hypothetical protein ACG873_21835 [Mesorhizobium sp. AaZ16]|uniref:hypothetical protein n=1 Tax=Mesorhizobium sp. AaZ16 TaxID=3402289 RepID=UPI00374FD357
MGGAPGALLRLIVETGSGGELHAGTISAISIILQSGMVEIGGSLFERLDGIDLGRLRRTWCALPGSTASELMAAALVALLQAQEMARTA